MAVMGLRGTGDWGTDERPKNFRETILWRQPNGQSPLTALMAKMGTESVDDPEFNWWEEQLETVRLQINGAMTNVATNAAVDLGGDNLVPGDLLLVEKADQVAYDNEIVEVTAVASATAFTIARGAAGTTAAAIPDDAKLTKIGNVYAEGSGSPNASTRNPAKKNNFCQIFKTSYELTESAKKTKTRTGDPLKNDKKRKMFDHSVAMEWAFLLGRKSETTGANGKPKRTTGGLRSFLTTNVTIFGGGNVLTEDSFMDAILPVFNYSSGAGDERLVLCGNAALMAVNRLARDSNSSNINHTETIKLYGMQLQRWILPQGSVYMKTHPLLNNHPIYSASMFVIDPSNLKYRPFRDTKPEDNIQANDSDTEKGQWISEVGLEVQHESTMAYLGNVK